MSNHDAGRLDRRDWCRFATGGLTTAALALLGQRQAGAAPHHRPRARRVIHICLVGGLSQVDTFDYKPELRRLHGKPLPAEPSTFFASAGSLRMNEWKFRQRGESGLWVSDLFPEMAAVADELCVIKSMWSESANHTPAMFLQNSGFAANGFPSLGSWLSFGLGNETDSLPTFVVLPDARSLPNSGAANWTSGFLPAEHQGTVFRGGKVPIRSLLAEAKERISPQAERAAHRLLLELNQKQLQRRGDDLLAARIKAYELAAKMQVSVPEAVDFAQESKATQTMYGLHQQHTADCGRRCLLARRLLERGVRFVQVYSGGAFGGSPRHGWDGHENNYRNHGREARLIDRPVAALIRDLKQRGLLDDTLVIFTSEFGRTPFAHAPRGVLAKGRDHNPKGFSVWLAGGGVRGGTAIGATDPFGWQAIRDRVSWPDFHATVLHLLGLDHQRLTYYHNGIARRLTNVHGHVVQSVLA